MKREEGQYIRMVDDELDFAALKLFDYSGKCVKIYIRVGEKMETTDEHGLQSWFLKLYNKKYGDVEEIKK